MNLSRVIYVGFLAHSVCVCGEGGACCMCVVCCVLSVSET